MSRTLSFNLDRITSGNHSRSPAFQVLVYDVRSTANTIQDVVVGNPLEIETGPRDFTDEAFAVQVRETAGDYVTNGIAASNITLTIEDANNLYNPMNLLIDPTGDGRWIRPGNVVQIIVGDNNIDSADWPTVFTGTFIGSPAYTSSRTSVTRRLSIGAVDRSHSFVDLPVTSPDFPINTSYLSVATDIAEISMELDAAEISFTGFGTTLTGHTSTQFVDESPLTSLANIMIVDGFLPRFNGDGILTQTQASTSGFPARFYADNDTIISTNYPGGEIDFIDSVCIIGLDANMTKVKQPIQDLAEIQITTGYFTQNEEFDTHWSEDRTVIAEDIQAKVLRSVTGSLNIAGAGEVFNFISAPDLGTGSEGFVGVTTEIDTGFAGGLLVIIAVAYLASAWIPDEVAGLIVGVTIPVGRAVQAALLVTILLIMTQIGRVHVLFRGSIIEYAFLEIRACAELDVLPGEQPNGVELQNHLVQTQAAADAVARDQLFLQVAKGLPRTITMMQDLKLEPHDIFEVTDPIYGARRFLIEGLSYTLRRNTVPLVVAQTSEITAGLTP